MLGRAPRTKETLPDFCENMDPDIWDTTMWYRVTRNPQEFHGLTGCQRDPRIWGITWAKSWVTSHRSTSLNQTLKRGNYWEGWLLVYIKVGSPLWKKVRESAFVIVRILVLRLKQFCNLVL